MSPARVTAASATSADGPVRSRWSSAAPGACGILVVAAYALLCWREVTSGLEFDEAFNLTVVRNLAEGLGYASNGGVQGVGVLRFDPYVTTGPTVLLPAAGVWSLTGSVQATRLVPLAFFVLYLLASWTLGKRVAGVAGGLAAMASPLLLAVGVRDLTTLSLVPGRLVGELPACALLVSAVVLLPSRRLWVAALGGLCAGLAVQAKLSFLVAAGIVGLVWLVADYRASGRTRPGRWLAVGLAAAGPSLAFEVYRWRSLGSGYQDNIDSLRSFLSWQAQPPGYLASGARVRAFPDLLSGPGLTVLVLAGLGAIVLELARRDGRPSGEEDPEADPQLRVQRALARAQLVAGLVVGALWVLSSIQPSLRQGLPTLLLGLPVVAAWAAGSLTRKDPSAITARARRVTGVVAGLSLVAVTAYAGTRVALDGDGADLLDQQRAAAEVIEATGTKSLPVDEWWTLPEFQVLTDLPLSNSPGAEPPTITVYTAVRALIERGSPDARLFSDECPQQLYASWGVLVCH